MENKRFWNVQFENLPLEKWTYVANDNACRYALNELELSIKAQCSFSDSVILLHHSNLRMGAESKALKRAK